MKPSPEHVQRVLQRERELTPWVFTPCRNDAERAELAHAIESSARRPQVQAELELIEAAA